MAGGKQGLEERVRKLRTQMKDKEAQCAESEVALEETRV